MLSAVARRVLPQFGAACTKAPTVRTQAGITKTSTPRAVTGAFAQKATFFSKIWEAFRTNKFPTRIDTGVERLEDENYVSFNRDPIYPPKGSGTKENPIEVPSEFKSRVVGFEHPESHGLYWFTVRRGHLYYVNDIGMYFTLVPVKGYEEHVKGILFPEDEPTENCPENATPTKPQ